MSFQIQIYCLKVTLQSRGLVYAESWARLCRVVAFVYADVFMFQIVNAAFRGKLGLGPFTWNVNESFYILALTKLDRGHREFVQKPADLIKETFVKTCITDGNIGGTFLLKKIVTIYYSKGSWKDDLQRTRYIKFYIITQIIIYQIFSQVQLV